MSAGLEWLIDASGCSSARLSSVAALRALCDEIVAALGLRVVGQPVWHAFPPKAGIGPGGVTGMYLLCESHLTCHTFPEYGSATFNLYCCRPVPHWDWEKHLAERLGATQVSARSFVRAPYREPPRHESVSTGAVAASDEGGQA